MRIKRVSAAVCLAGMLLAASPALAGNAEKLDGRWQVVQMITQEKRVEIPPGTTMTMEFRAATQRWRFVVKTKDDEASEQGSFTLRGDQLTTQTDDALRVENIRVDFQGSIITLHKEDGTLTLRRE